MNDDNNKKAELLGQLYDIRQQLDCRVEPFLYYLPEIIKQKELSLINLEHAVIFTKLALKHDQLPFILDAKKILNKLVNTEDGSLKTPGRDIFYENNNFFWKELGDHTKAEDVILHIFNKTMFYISVGKLS